MLPEALQGTVGPSESLLCQHPQGLRRFGPADRRLFIANLVPELTYLERKILILGECVGAEATTFFNQLSSPRADCARYHRDAIQAGKRAAVHILRGDVLQGLPACNDVDAISNFRISG